MEKRWWVSSTTQRLGERTRPCPVKERSEMGSQSRHQPVETCLAPSSELVSRTTLHNAPARENASPVCSRSSPTSDVVAQQRSNSATSDVGDEREQTGEAFSLAGALW